MKKRMKERKGNSRFYFEEIFKIPKSKRSQVSVFVILAIVLVAAGGIAFYISKNSSSGLNQQFSSDAGVQAKFEQIRDSVVGCIDVTTAGSLDTIGIQGGYYDAPEKSFNLEWAFIPYYYYEGSAMVPDTVKVEGELIKYVNDNIKVCMDSIDKGDFNLDYKTPTTSVKIDTADVKFNIDMPLSVSRDKKTVMFNLKDEPLYYAVPLKDILDLAKSMTNDAVTDDKMVCLSCITTQAAEKNLKVGLVNLEEAGTLVVITSNNTVNGEYAFEFLNKYKG